MFDKIIKSFSRNSSIYNNLEFIYFFFDIEFVAEKFFWVLNSILYYLIIININCFFILFDIIYENNYLIVISTKNKSQIFKIWTSCGLDLGIESFFSKLFYFQTCEGHLSYRYLRFMVHRCFVGDKWWQMEVNLGVLGWFLENLNG